MIHGDAASPARRRYRYGSLSRGACGTMRLVNVRACFRFARRAHVCDRHCAPSLKGEPGVEASGRPAKACSRAARYVLLRSRHNAFSSMHRAARAPLSRLPACAVEDALRQRETSPPPRDGVRRDAPRPRAPTADAQSVASGAGDGSQACARMRHRRVCVCERLRAPARALRGADAPAACGRRAASWSPNQRCSTCVESVSQRTNRARARRLPALYCFRTAPPRAAASHTRSPGARASFQGRADARRGRSSRRPMRPRENGRNPNSDFPRADACASVARMQACRGIHLGAVRAPARCPPRTLSRAGDGRLLRAETTEWRPASGASCGARGTSAGCLEAGAGRRRRCAVAERGGDGARGGPGRQRHDISASRERALAAGPPAHVRRCDAKVRRPFLTRP